jgi:hypothetical protein
VSLKEDIERERLIALAADRIAAVVQELASVYGWPVPLWMVTGRLGDER